MPNGKTKQGIDIPKLPSLERNGAFQRHEDTRQGKRLSGAMAGLSLAFPPNWPPTDALNRQLKAISPGSDACAADNHSTQKKVNSSSGMRNSFVV